MGFETYVKMIANLEEDTEDVNGFMA